MRPLVTGLALICAAGIAGAQVPALDTALERRTREVASSLRCPVCQGLSIADSPSELALEMKGLVRDQLAAGKTPDEVRAYFITKYGEWVLLEPKAEGLNLLVYLLPVLGIGAGGWVVWHFVRSHSGRSATSIENTSRTEVR